MAVEVMSPDQLRELLQRSPLVLALGTYKGSAACQGVKDVFDALAGLLSPGVAACRFNMKSGWVKEFEGLDTGQAPTFFYFVRGELAETKVGGTKPWRMHIRELWKRFRDVYACAAEPPVVDVTSSSHVAGCVNGNPLVAVAVTDASSHSGGIVRTLIEIGGMVKGITVARVHGEWRPDVVRDMGGIPPNTLLVYERGVLKNVTRGFGAAFADDGFLVCALRKHLDNVFTPLR